MPARTEVTVDEGMRVQESLRLTERSETLHVPLTPSGWTMRILGSVVEVTALAMFGAGQQLTLRDAVTPEFVGDDHPRLVRQPFERPSEEPLRRLAIPTLLDQDVQHGTMLIHGTPQIMQFAVDPDKHLVEVPLIARPGTPSADPVREYRGELRAPAPDGLVRDSDATLSQKQLDIAEAETEGMMEPDGVTDDLSRKAVSMMWTGFALHPVMLIRTSTGGQSG